jgi:lipopolysaccharide export system permease protein
MKALHRHVLKSFIGPLAVTLAIALFVLLMQFLWKYIDDMVGKGLSWYVITKLMVLATVTLIPMALPLAILLASIMTFGNLAENHELVAMKSAGMSLPKIMASLIVFVTSICIGAFFFSNNVLPVVNLKMGSLLYDIREAKPALNIQPDVFYNGIDGYDIRIEKKDEDQQTVHNILIYDHTAGIGNNKVVMAKWGTMKMSTNKQYLIFTMYDGNVYEEMADNGQLRPSRPMVYNNFKQQTVYFDLSSFKFSRTNEELFKNNYEMLDMKQLKYSADSISRVLDKSKIKFAHEITESYYSIPKILRRGIIVHAAIPNALQSRMAVLDAATNLARNAKQFIEADSRDFDSMQEDISRRRIEMQFKFTFPIACLILFFIGAPFGAIIKKGGLGLPVVVSALFFMLYYVITIVGKKSAIEGVMSVPFGMWMPSMIFFPFGIFFTYKATMDSALFDRDAYSNFFNKLAKVFRKVK